MQLPRKKPKKPRKRLKKPPKQLKSKPKRMQKRQGRRQLRKPRRQGLKRKKKRPREKSSRNIQIPLKKSSRILARNAATDRTLIVTKRSRRRTTPLPTLRRCST